MYYNASIHENNFQHILFFAGFVILQLLGFENVRLKWVSDSLKFSITSLLIFKRVNNYFIIICSSSLLYKLESYNRAQGWHAGLSQNIDQKVKYGYK